MAIEDAISSAIAAVDAAEAAALRGDAEAKLAYQLSEQILQGQFVSMPALAALELVTLSESLAAYTAVAAKAKAAAAEVASDEQAAETRVEALFQKYQEQLAGKSRP